MRRPIPHSAVRTAALLAALLLASASGAHAADLLAG